jgi:hypothetical protein
VRRLFNLLGTTTAIATCLIMLIGLLTGGGLAALTATLLQIAVVIAACTLLMGVLNLIGVHGGRVLRRGRGWVYSLVLLAALALVLGLWIAGNDADTRLLLDTVQVSIEAALGGLVLFALVFGAFRLMRRRVTLSAMLFTAAVIIALVAALPLTTVAPVVAVRDWLVAVPVSAGVRGLLIGVALATVITGIRVLIGQDRSMRE